MRCGNVLTTNTKTDINIFLFIIFFTINFFQPLIVDDLCRGGVAALYHHTLFQTMAYDYFNWTGRMSAQFLAYIFFNQPYEQVSIFIFNVLNAFVLVVFYNITYKFASNNKYKLGSFLLFLLTFTLYLNYADFLKNAVWKTVGLQYFWGVVLILWFLQKEYFRTDVAKNNLIVSFVIGLFIGLYNELFFATVLVIYAFALFYNTYIDRVNVGIKSKNILYFNLGNVLGGLLLIAAPGNYVRQHSEGISSENAFNFLLLLRKISHDPMLMTMLLLCLAVMVIKGWHARKNNRYALSIVTLALFQAALLMIYLPVSSFFGYASRMVMMLFVLLFLIFVRQVWFVFEADVLNKKQGIALLAIVNCLMAAVFLYGYHHLYQFNMQRMAKIAQAQIDPSHTYLFAKYIPPNRLEKLAYFDDLSADPSNWKNSCFAAYYHLAKVKLGE